MNNPRNATLLFPSFRSYVVQGNSYLGAGSFSVVRAGEEKLTGKPVAVKSRESTRKLETASSL